jgi:hypothetical protein
MNPKVFPTHTSTASSAEICRQMGWQPGDVLDGHAPGSPQRDRVRIQITGIGDREILARTLAVDGSDFAGVEAKWDLSHREWGKLEEAAS